MRGSTQLKSEGKALTPESSHGYYTKLVDTYPILSIEDGLAEDDWAGWKPLAKNLGTRIELIGDDIFVTSTDLVKRGIAEGIANSVLIKSQPDRNRDRERVQPSISPGAPSGTNVSHRRARRSIRSSRISRSQPVPET